jgi:hypothetical protein
VLPDCIMNALFTGSQRNRADDVTISGCVATRHDSSYLDAVSGEVDMRRRAKEFIEISDHTSLDMLIKTLVAIRDDLDPHAEPELKLRGDDIFGRRLSISYFRELTEEEIALDVRYEHAQFSADAREIERLQKALDQIPSRRDDDRLRDAA